MDGNASHTYYFDTCTLLKYYKYKEEKGTLAIRRLVATYKPIFVSELTLLECYSVFMASYRRKEIRRRDIKKLSEQLKKDVNRNPTVHSSRPFGLVYLPENSFRLAENILLHDAAIYNIGSNDALHLAIAQKSLLQPLMVTSDKGLQHVCERNQMSFYDPENDSDGSFEQ